MTCLVLAFRNTYIVFTFLSTPLRVRGRLLFQFATNSSILLASCRCFPLAALFLDHMHSPPSSRSFICIASYLFILSFIHTHTGAFSLSNEMTRVAVVTGANKVRQLLDMNDKMRTMKMRTYHSFPLTQYYAVVPPGHWIRHRTASCEFRFIF